MKVNCAIINESSVRTDAEVDALAVALTFQARYHFAKYYGIWAHCYPLPKGSAVPPGYWALVILDTSDQAGALGYHDVTAEGLPLGKVFAKDDEKYGYSWSITASHELCEMLADPEISTCVQIDGKRMFAYESADACEDDSLGYEIGGVLVSDFVTPAWFYPMLPPPYDHKGHISAPLEILAGGYIGVLTLGGGSGWTQLTAKQGTTRRHHEIDGGRLTLRERKRTDGGLRRSQR